MYDDLVDDPVPALLVDHTVRFGALGYLAIKLIDVFHIAANLILKFLGCLRAATRC